MQCEWVSANGMCVAFGAFAFSKCLRRDMTTVTASDACTRTHQSKPNDFIILVNEMNMKTWSINIHNSDWKIADGTDRRSYTHISWKTKSRSSSSSNNATIGLIGIDTVRLNKHSNEINVLLKSPKLEIHDIEHNVCTHRSCVCVLMEQFFVSLTSTEYTCVYWHCLMIAKESISFNP